MSSSVACQVSATVPPAETGPAGPTRAKVAGRLATALIPPPSSMTFTTESVELVGNDTDWTPPSPNKPSALVIAESLPSSTSKVGCVLHDSRPDGPAQIVTTVLPSSWPVAEIVVPLVSKLMSGTVHAEAASKMTNEPRMRGAVATIMPHARSRTWIACGVGIVTAMSGIAACGGPAAPIANKPAPVAKSVGGAYAYRMLRAGRARDAAARTRFELTLGARDATLVETEETSPAHSIGEADTAAWTVKSTRTYHGAASEAGGVWLLALDSPGVQSLALRCAHTTIAVVRAGAIRVKTPGYASECGDRGVWEPAETVKVDVLRCGEAMQPADEGAGDDDDDALMFAAPPGVELAGESDECYLQGQGLRMAR